MESEASCFAFCLLMPEFMVRAEMKKINPMDMVDSQIDIVSEIACIFQVTNTVAAIRLHQLGYIST